MLYIAWAAAPSAPQGFAPAQSSLAMRYWAGAGVPEDRREAYAWLLLAAAQGERDARDRAPAIAAELSDADREQARDRALRYRRGAL
jgi:hypothetical protein